MGAQNDGIEFKSAASVHRRLPAKDLEALPRDLLSGPPGGIPAEESLRRGASAWMKNRSQIRQRLGLGFDYIRHRPAQTRAPTIRKADENRSQVSPAVERHSARSISNLRAPIGQLGGQNAIFIAQSLDRRPAQLGHPTIASAGNVLPTHGPMKDRSAHHDPISRVYIGAFPSKQRLPNRPLVAPRRLAE